MKNWIKKRLIKLFTCIGLSSFQTKDGRSYRVTGYYFCYNFSDGDRRFVRCHKVFANTIGGSGVAGVQISFKDVSSIKFSLKRWHFFRDSFKSRKRQIKKDKDTFDFLKSIEKGLTKNEFEDLAWELTWKSFESL